MGQKQRAAVYHNNLPTLASTLAAASNTSKTHRQAGSPASNEARRPPQWPPSIQFITSPRYHSSVSAATRALLTHGARPGPSPPRRAVSPPVRIRLITDPRHPVCGQCGLFTLKKIPQRSHVVDYIGQVHCEERADSDYDLSLYRSQDGVNVGIDAREMGNDARFINDYRGVRDRPNAEFVEYRTVGGELRIGIWTRGEAIRKGEEILVSYGKSWWASRGTECHI